MAIDPIVQYHQKLGKYPGNNKQWWVARAETDNTDTGVKAGDFTPDILDKLFSGNNQAPKGHFILNAFNKDRGAVSGIPGLTPTVIKERPGATTFFAGRIWFACNSTVYFSQILTAKHKAGLCFQEADPTAEDISDLIATDGGEIPIPQANKIVRIIANAGGILVFALNGVWNITGTNQGFSALDISVNKVSPVGCRSPLSVVETDTAVFWWSDVGILGMSQQQGQYAPINERANISETTIQTLYNEIPDLVRKEVKGVFDDKLNTVVWLYRDEEVGPDQYNRVLIFDISLTAFYPWKISKLLGDDTPRVKGVFVSQNSISLTNPSTLKFTSLGTNKLRFMQFNSREFVDWKSFDGKGVPYYSYVETGYELMNDAMRKKQITYVITYLRETEKGDLENPSSCEMQIKWDWASSSTSNKWTVPVQIYRPGRFKLMDIGEYDTGFPMVITKNKVRGSGRSIQFRFGTQEPGRDFDLYGWSVALTGNTVA